MKWGVYTLQFSVYNMDVSTDDDDLTSSSSSSSSSRRKGREKEGDVYYATARALLMSSHRVFLYKALCVQQTLSPSKKQKNNLLLIRAYLVFLFFD